MSSTTNNTPQNPPQLAKKPDEKTGFTVAGVVKIYDPETKQVYVEKRI